MSSSDFVYTETLQEVMYSQSPEKIERAFFGKKITILHKIQIYIKKARESIKCGAKFHVVTRLPGVLTAVQAVCTPGMYPQGRRGACSRQQKSIN